ncbi:MULTISPECIES: helix-turn-helix transcriptional regulator [unclassified Adlercreutzia]|uniref:helix-turn-helix transcriptional regulator n=1 Tax=unclassified Adlercreutzia TaxID=2636013 RepID=UPI0013EC6937|nr:MULTISPECIES: helix-turn-helix transcriptional regulator [unclassified Adlercreutzia]
MSASFPHITISIAHSADGSDSAGDLNSLCIGFGLFQAWLYLAVFGPDAIFAASESFPALPYLTPGLATIVFDVFSVAFTVSLLLIAFSNQLLLKFYVGKNALIMATVLVTGGTYLMYLSCAVGEAGEFVAGVAAVAMGAGASSMIALWGTAFSRYEFTTIILNTAAAIVIGVAAYFVFIHWVLPPVAGILTGVLPVFAALLLWKLTPIPYYRRQEMPIFHPLPVRRMAFVTRFGVPTFIFGFSIGVLRYICVDKILPINDITSQLVVGAAACAGVGIIIATVALTKSESHWDMIFRCLVPVIAGSIMFLPELDSNVALLANFLVICSYICFECLMWVFFSDISQEFRLSPIFVFGLGRGLLTLTSFVGTMAAQLPTMESLAFLLGDADGALFLMFTVILAYALMPRQREIRAIIDPTRVTIEPGYSAFQAEIDHAEPIAPNEDGEVTAEMEAEADARARAKGRFHARCEEIADRYLLSRRETEVMFLLAKGHNAAFIQDKLCISKSTAKTHINHIYRKLDIHTQQELLNMVEDRLGEDAASEDRGNGNGGGGGKPGAKPKGARDIFEPKRR